MYVPGHFEEKRVEVLHRLICEHPFGALVTLGAGGLEANHIPFELDEELGPLGTLRGHVARANPVWREFNPEMEALILFQGPHAYVSPSWYPSKKASGKVVPTWNYLVVHAYGHMRVVEEPKWLQGLVERLTLRHESSRVNPWKVSDAPPEFIERLLDAIVGIEIPITRLVGKAKLSQNRGVADRAGVIAGLQDEQQESALAVAEAMAHFSPRGS